MIAALPPELQAQIQVLLMQQLQQEQAMAVQGASMPAQGLAHPEQAPVIKSERPPESMAILPSVPIPEPVFAPEDVELVAFSDENITRSSLEAIERIIALEPTFTISVYPTAAAVGAAAPLPTNMLNNQVESLSAARTGWLLLIVRLTGMYAFSPELASKAQDKLMEHELAVLWLYEEFRLDLQGAPVGEDGKSRYDTLFFRILQGLKGRARAPEEKLPGLDPKDRTFTKFLVDAPYVPPESVEDVVKSYCEDPERFAEGPDHVTLGPLVENFALMKLRSLRPDDDEEQGEILAEADAVRQFELYFALCNKKHDLLAE
ncbi:hypothetical protein HK101_001426 [Irineochytrium annulatum]|nr:hypothetical protein HK101_001426 [Irineochytrium annulatum]